MHSKTDQKKASSFERFILKETIGNGGFGKVKRAIDTQTGLECAVKIIYNKN